MTLLKERKGDIEFLKSASKIYSEILSQLKKRMWAVLEGNEKNTILSEFDGVNVRLGDLDVPSLPEILQDTYLIFAWGNINNPMNDASFLIPSPALPGGAIVIAHNVDIPEIEGMNVAPSAVKKRSELRKAFGYTSELVEGEDIIEYVPAMFTHSKSAFMHELRHAYDMLVRDDDGKMAQYMHKTLEASQEIEHLEVTSDDELNAYIIGAMQDTLDEFVSWSKGKQTKENANKWAPTGTVLWNKLYRNISSLVKHYVIEDKLLKRAFSRFADVWNDYVDSLPD